MKVILRARVKGLGEPGAVVEVAPGYARNYLMPRGLAAEASPAALRQVEDDRRRESSRKDRELEAARADAERLEGATVRIQARAGEQGRLFGSVTNQDLAEAVASQIGLKVDRRRIELEEPIKSLGSHRVAVRLHAEVSAQLLVEVTAE